MKHFELQPFFLIFLLFILFGVLFNNHFTFVVKQLKLERIVAL